MFFFLLDSKLASHLRKQSFELGIQKFKMNTQSGSFKSKISSLQVLTFSSYSKAIAAYIMLKIQQQSSSDVKPARMSVKMLKIVCFLFL